MSQLSTIATQAKQPINLLKDIKDHIDRIPNYLTKQHKSFQEIIHQALPSIKPATTTTSVKSNKNINHNMDELRKIAILIYKIRIIHTYQYLWTSYLKSGMGQLILPSQTQHQLSYSTTLSIWPNEIKTMVLSNKMDKTIEHETCLKICQLSIK